MVGHYLARYHECTHNITTACEAAGSTRGVKDAMVAHLVKNRARHCKNASDKAINAALALKYPNENCSVVSSRFSTRPQSSSDVSDTLSQPPAKKPKQAQISRYVFKGLDIPFSAGQAEAFRTQCLRAIISSGAPFGFFEDPEVQLLFKMARTAAPAILPTGKAIGGGLLNEASKRSEDNLKSLLRGRMIGIVDDGWKGARKEKLDRVCANVDFKVSSTSLS